MDDKGKYNISVDKLNQQAEITANEPDISGYYYRYILKPQEGAIKEALMRLGWTPPDNIPETAPPPLQEGDWVTANIQMQDDTIFENELLYVEIVPKHDNQIKCVDLEGNESFHLISNLTPHTLTKDDLPDGWEFTDDLQGEGEPYMRECLFVMDDGTNIITQSENVHNAVAKALEHHLGQQLLKKAGGK